MLTVALLLAMVSFATFVAETFLYFGFVKWYYGAGPALNSQCWQTRASRQEVVEAIDSARKRRGKERLKLASKRRAGDVFLLRFRWWDLSIWSRVMVRVVEGPGSHGAVIGYEVRPFVSPAMVALSVLLFFESSRLQLLTVGYFLVVVLMYAIGLWWELRKLRGLEPLRRELAGLGLAVCAKCGYDRFGLQPEAVCPECGAPG
ncbi:MAG: hypothetical protein L0Y44_09360 [Phycisphaerales bacterium]|nr:hypothetical protein [Phycisphaerales bacterium]MCI0630846.1 hypothetical protein [Phycisphaerales bacterium]MCI0674658.1 hypothetical protein [Phycisphaerales bacterium]